MNYSARTILFAVLFVALAVLLLFGHPVAPPDMAYAVIATGVAKQLRYKKESAWATAPGTGSAQLLRRVTSDLSLKKQTYQSNEIRSDYQIADMRHGVRSVEGSINGELSPGTWKDFMAAVTRKAYAAVSAISSLSITISGSGPTYTVARGSGSWLTDGIKAGDIVRLTAGSFNAANINKNLVVLSETALNLTVMPLNGVALVAEGPIGSATLSVPGKKTFVPTTGHTDDSFYIEHWHADVSLSEAFSGCKVNQLSLGMPPSGIATIGLDFIGKDITTAGSAYYVSPTAETATGVLASVNGVLLVQGAAVALLTGLSLTVKGDMDGAVVVGSNTYADIMEGRVLVEGSMSAYFSDATLRDYFINETEIALVAAFSSNNAAASDFVSVSLPRIKVGGASKDDGDKGIVQTLPFTALYNATGGAGTSSEQSTVVFQDSQA